MERVLKGFLKQRWKALIAGLVATTLLAGIIGVKEVYFDHKLLMQILGSLIFGWILQNLIVSLVLLLWDTYAYTSQNFRLLEELPEDSQLARKMSDIVNGTRGVRTQVTEFLTGVTYLRHFLSLNLAFRDQIQTIVTGLEKISAQTYTFPPLEDYVVRYLLVRVEREISRLSVVQAIGGPRQYAEQILGGAKVGPLLITSLVGVEDLLTQREIDAFIAELHQRKAETYNLIFADQQKYGSDTDYTQKIDDVKQRRECPSFHYVVCPINQQDEGKGIYVDCAITPHGMFLSNVKAFGRFENVKFVELSSSNFSLLIGWYARRFKDCFLQHCQEDAIKAKFEKSFDKL